MGVEFFEHTVDGIFGKLLLVNAVDLEGGDGYLCHLEFLDLFKVQSVVGALRHSGQGCQEAEKEGQGFHVNVQCIMYNV